MNILALLLVELILPKSVLACQTPLESPSLMVMVSLKNMCAGLQTCLRNLPTAGEVQVVSPAINVSEGSDAMFCVVLMNLTDSTATLANPLIVSLIVDLNWRAGLSLILGFYKPERS